MKHVPLRAASEALTQVDLAKARLSPSLNEPYFTTVSKGMALGRRCTHQDHGVTLDEIDRRVYCNGCKTQIDPFEALLSFAASERRLVDTLDQIHRAQKRHEEKLLEDKARRHFQRAVTGRAAILDKTLKAEPVIGYVITLECGHLRETKSEGARFRQMTCPECRKAAEQAAKGAR